MICKVYCLFACLFAASVFGLTQTATGGDYGCGSRYYGTQGHFVYTTPTYSYPTYQAPTYTAPTYYPPQVYNTPVETFYRVAPDLAAARIAQEASAETMKQFKAELAAQAAAQEKALATRADAEFKAQVLQLLSQRQADPSVLTAAGDPVRGRLEAENLALRQTISQISVYLEKLSGQQPTAAGPGTDHPTGTQTQPQQPTSPTPAKLDLSAGKNPLEAVKISTQSLCMPCHSAAGRMNLTDPSKLYYEDLTDCINRMISDDPAFVMPKPSAGKGSAPIEVIGAFHKLAMTAPHKPTAGTPATPPPIPAGAK